MTVVQMCKLELISDDIHVPRSLINGKFIINSTLADGNFTDNKQ